MVWGSIENKINPVPNIYPNDTEIEDYDKFRFNSDTDFPLDTLIEFRSLVINVSCVNKCSLKKIMNIIQKSI